MNWPYASALTSNDTQRMLPDRPPRTLADYLHDNRDVWIST